MAIRDTIRNIFRNKDIKNKLYTGIPLTMYFISFIFTILLEIVNAQLNIKLVLTFSFWGDLLIKYGILLLVLAIMLPFFDNKLKQANDYQVIKEKARSINDDIVQRRLTSVYIDYTKQEMDEEEKRFLQDRLTECGKIDFSYLESDCTLDFIKKQYKEKKLLKDQYLLLKRIKKGHLTFSKLTGNEIRFIGEYDVDEQNKYKNSSKAIVVNELIIKIVLLFGLNILLTILLNSLLGGSVGFKKSKLEIALAIFTTLVNYITAVIFAMNVAKKRVDENLRFTEAVSLFSTLFLEKIETKAYIPSVNNDVQEQLKKYNNIEDEEESPVEETIELTEEEIKFILEKRGKEN